MVLARAGVRVLVVDRSHYGADTLSTHALMRGGVLQLARWGLLDEVVAAGTPPVRGSVFHYGAQRVEVPIKPGPGVDALYAPRRTVLDPILVDAARDAGAEVRFGVTVSHLCRDSTGRVTGMVGHDSAGHLVTARARITVGADGMGSRVARQAGAPVERRAHGAAAFIYGYWDRLPVHDYELFYRPGVAAGFFPTNGGQVCVFVAVPRQRFRAETRSGTTHAYARLLAEATTGALDGAVFPEHLSVFAARPGFLRRAHGPGWALVGDAGYFKDPITSHGLTDALRDADLLAHAILAAAGGEAPEPDALAGYQAARDRVSERLFTTTDAIASFDWDLDQIPLLLRELSDSMRDEVTLLGELENRAAPTAQCAMSTKRE
jgi:flavin-dependent dehydrogenase